MELWDSNYSIPKYILHVDSGLQFTLHIYNWLLPDIHPLYTTHRRRMDSARVVDFLEAIRDEKYAVCEEYGVCLKEHPKHSKIAKFTLPLVVKCCKL